MNISSKCILGEGDIPVARTDKKIARYLLDRIVKKIQINIANKFELNVNFSSFQTMHLPSRCVLSKVYMG